MRMRLLAGFFALFLGFSQLACSSFQKRFNQVEVGMSKASVLDLVGGPVRNQRVNGTNEWTYLYYENDQRKFKLITFKHGQVLRVAEHSEKPSLEQQISDAGSLKEYEKLVKKRRQEGAVSFDKIPEME